MEPGWHVYWINPGDAGDPPRVKWEAPAGFVVGDFRWPTPTRLVTGPVVDYGYEGRVLLAAPVTVPASHKAGSAVPIAADIRYVICREVCISATARATLAGATVPAAERQARIRDLIAKVRAEAKPAMAKARLKTRIRKLANSRRRR